VTVLGAGSSQSPSRPRSSPSHAAPRCLPKRAARPLQPGRSSYLVKRRRSRSLASPGRRDLNSGPLVPRTLQPSGGECRQMVRSGRRAAIYHLADDFPRLRCIGAFSDVWASTGRRQVCPDNTSRWTIGAHWRACRTLLTGRRDLSANATRSSALVAASEAARKP
jgi:hypothetical protein